MTDLVPLFKCTLESSHDFIAVERPVSQTAPAQIPACRFPAPGSSEVLASASGLRRMKPPVGPGLGAAREFVARAP